ncbi:hypothetical protein Poli38472_011506 [Pythium oligandrum]|uniref:Uncharacterized protein n=1 Tax=Pythium oligandrum TaxID=41045 RepID=A0A8K1CJ85_PYTOL|nr:hypothetical protein Poli38472_011506 [Pythium oligandrum]|eukprot:TMW64626.1 hypothetical protein Poli38472_011506 [Pythium oligandrum]
MALATVRHFGILFCRARGIMLGARQPLTLLSLSLWAATVTASSRLVPLRPASSLMPDWKEVSPRGVGIHLLNVDNAWVEDTTEDQSVAFALFPYSEAKRLEAKRQIEAYYDAARARLQKHDMGIKYSKTKYLVVKDAVTVCLKTVSAPVFEVSDEDEMEQTQSPVPTTDVPLPTTLPPTPEPSTDTPSPVVMSVFAEDLDAGIFPSSALYIEHNCKLKFRFSVLGGLPPVEYFTRAEPLVNFKQLKQWVAKQMRIFIRDAEEGRIQLDKDRSQVFQCIQAVLTSLESRNALGRATYYDLGAQIAACI